MTTNTAPLLTIDDLTALPDDLNTYELIEGELIVSGMPTLTHQRVIGELLYPIASYLNENPFGEVLPISPGRENARRDRVKKLRVYGKFGVGEYWVADPEARTVEIYRPAGGALALVATVGGDEEITSPLLPGFVCKVSRVF